MIGNEDVSRQADSWAGPDGGLGTYIVEETRKTLDAYKHKPGPQALPMLRRTVTPAQLSRAADLFRQINERTEARK